MNAQLPMIVEPAVAGELPTMLRYPSSDRPLATLFYVRGEIDNNDNGGPRWRIEGSPLVIVAAMKMLSGVRSRKRDTCSFPATQANFEDLIMLMHRYPIRVDQRASELFDRAFEHLVSAWRSRNGLDRDTRQTAQIFKGDLLPFQREGVDFMVGQRRCLNADDMGLGKAQPLDAKVLTPNGWVRMGDLHVGDQITGANGKPTFVTGVFPQGRKTVFRVTFSDGTSTECCDDHLWSVRSAVQKRRGNPFEVKSLSTIRHKLLFDGAGNARFFVPIIGVFDGAEFDAPLDPYLLGVLLGDGGLRHRVILTCADDEIVETVRGMIPSGHTLTYIDQYDYRISSQGAGRTNLVRLALERLGLFGKGGDDKFIPEPYLFGSVGQRVALLQGLLDTDGYCAKDGAVQFSSNSRDLVDGVRHLVQSLGGVARLSSKISASGKMHWITTIAVGDGVQPFRLRRKADRFKGRVKYKPSRAIVAVEEIGEKECQCISVAAPDHLYVTDHFIVTHNTIQAFGFLDEVNEWPAVIVVQSHVQRHWERKIEEFLNVRKATGGLLDKTGLTWLSLQGARPKLALPQADIYVVHYLVLHGWVDFLRNRGVRTVVFDEVQEARHTGTRKADAIHALARFGRNVVGLSGTPIYNRGIEIFTVMNTLSRGCLGLRTEFIEAWCGIDRQVVEQPAALGRYLQDRGLMIRRRKEDVLTQLPAKRRVIEPISADNEEFAELVKEAAQLARDATRINDPFDRGRMEAEAMAKARRATGIAKAPAIVAFVRGLLEAGEPTLVFCHHHAVHDLLLETLEEFKPASISGRESIGGKEISQKRFENGETNLCLIALRAATGLDGLQKRARVVVFAELDWSPAIHKQAEDRAHRMGQHDSVLVYYLVTDLGTDPDMMAALAVKESQFTGLMQDKEETLQDREAAREASKVHMSNILTMLRSIR